MDAHAHRALGIAIDGDWHRSLSDVAVNEADEHWAAHAFTHSAVAASIRHDRPEHDFARHAGIAVHAFRDRPTERAISRVGVTAFRAVLLSLLDGDRAQAQAAWLALDPSFDARRTAWQDATLPVPEADQRAADWATFASALELVASKPLAAFVPILLAAITPAPKRK